MTSESGWQIPDDWPGAEWECYTVMWPKSTSYRRLLTAMIYALTRGREYDGDSGSITDAQMVGWQIFDRNNPLTLCAGESEETDEIRDILGMFGEQPDNAEDNEDEEMPIYVNVATSELVYVCGCQEYRFPLSSGGASSPIDAVTNQDGTETQPGVPVIPETWETGYTTCGMAETLIDRIFAIGDAAWDNRTDPYSIADAIRAANPGYTFSMVNVTKLFIATTEVSLIEGFGDTDLFNDEAQKQWRCYVRNLLSGDVGQDELISASEWLNIKFWPLGFAILDEVPDAGTTFDVVWAGFWEAVCDVLGRHRAGQICYEAAGVEGDCDDCNTPNPPATIYSGDLIFTGSVSDVTTHGDQSITWLNQGKTLNVKVSNITAGSWKGLVDDTEFYMQALSGTTVTSFKVAVEMVQGNLSQEWQTADCGTQPSTAWSVSGDTGEVRTDYGGGDSITEATPDAGWTSVGYMTADVRFCPHDDLEGQTVEFNMHILEVNGVPTGVSNPHAGKTPL